MSKMNWLEKILFIDKIFLCCLLGFMLTSAAINGFLRYPIARIEATRKYDVNLTSEYTFDCNIQYYDSDHTFQCAKQTINGDYTKYDTTELKSDGLDYALEADGTKFTKTVASPIIPTNVFENLVYDLPGYLDKTSSTTETFEILNLKLNRYVYEKSTKITWHFSQDDIAKIDQKHNEWLAKKKQEKADADAKAAAEAAQKQAEADAKAAADAKQKSDEEAKRKADEATAAAAAAKAAADAAKEKSSSTSGGASGSSSGKSTGDSSSSSGGSTAAPSTDSSNNLPLKAICKDGSVSYQNNPAGTNYRGMCSGHGGIAQKLGRVK